MLNDVEQRYPRHYTMIDAKLRILAEMKIANCPPLPGKAGSES
jgi:hypothetical protein